MATIHPGRYSPRIAVVHRLWVLLPPSNIAATISKLQNAVFKRFGFSSSMALPPCIPLAYAAAPKDVPEIGHELYSFRIDMKTFSVIQDCVFLTTACTGNLSVLRSRLQAAVRCLPEPQGFVPLADGFFLSVDETGEIASMVKAGMEVFPGGVPSGGVPSDGDPSSGTHPTNTPQGFSAFSVALLEVHAHADPWWRRVVWEIRFEKRVKKTRPLLNP